MKNLSYCAYVKAAGRIAMEAAQYAEALEKAVLDAAELYEKSRRDPTCRGHRLAARRIIMRAAEIARARNLGGEIDRANEQQASLTLN